jgi:hypothetical protein
MSDCLIAPNCYQKEQKIIPYFKVDENFDINAVKPSDEVRHSLPPFVQGCIWWAVLLLDQVWASYGPRGTSKVARGVINGRQN